MRMGGALVDAEIAQLLALERAARQHAPDRRFEHALGEFAVQVLVRLAFLDAARKTGVPVIGLGLALVAGQHNLLGIDDDDIIATIKVWSEGRLMLATQAVGDD